MHLRSINLRGFKSFPDAVEVRLEPGVAVVVGPNGSGKSNVADAIVWAAGSLAPSVAAGREARGRPLRRLRRPGRVSDHCEVELLFDNAAGDGPLPYAELSIARRLHRGGEGQYLVNRAAVRRTDVLELLGDAGLGHEMHAVIGQGRVEQVLSSKPSERRALIEEAAGLGSFKHRRHRAELKLARVAIQADKARALEDEARKRLRPLALQATAAQRAEKLAVEIERIRACLLAGRLASLEDRLAGLEGQRAGAVQERRRRDERLEGVLAERRRAEEELEQAARRHEQATASLYRLRSAAERLARPARARGRVGRGAAPGGDPGEGPGRRAARLDAARRARRRGGAPSREAGSASRAALHERETLEASARLAADRLVALERSLAEREGLPPAARALADRGEPLALSLLDVDAGYERAVAAALASRAAAVVAADARSAFELAEEARTGGLGSLTVLLPPRAQKRLRAARGPCGRRGAQRARAPASRRRAGRSAARGRLGRRAGRPRRGRPRCRCHARGSWLRSRERRAVVRRQGGRERPDRASRPQPGARGGGRAAPGRRGRAAGDAARVFEVERAARERVTKARAAVALMPPQVEPEEAELLERLADAAERLCSTLTAASSAAGTFEPALQARVDAGGASSAELGEELRRLGAQESELRRAAAEAAQAVSGLEVDAARVGAERDDVRARLPDDTEPAQLDVEAAEELESTLGRLERRREQLGQVNPLAAEELEEEKARLAELTEQREDLDRSLQELEALRDELSETVERRFEETFAAVERHFAEVAAALFPGGEGRLQLTVPEDDEAEPGVEVELRPAGKKVTRLSLLSGGEKALGALSFLFALFLARPCPFYLLDEVEAALDDTNIGRFVDLLRRYADRAQFIVITHQKRTMEAADILYGVTMGADGVSQIVSKRLQTPAARVASA